MIMTMMTPGMIRHDNHQDDYAFMRKSIKVGINAFIHVSALSLGFTAIGVVSYHIMVSLL